MSNVIFVDFNKNKVLGQNVSDIQFESVEDYFDFLYSKGLDIDDVLDLAEAIDDANFYMNADPEIQDLANFWFSYKKQF